MVDRPAEATHRPGVLLLSTSFVTMTRLRSALARDGRFACHCAGSVARGREAIAAARIAALVLESEDAAGDATVPLVRAARERDASVAVVALLRREAGWTPAALALVASQPTIAVIAEDFDAMAVLHAIAPPVRAGDLLADVWPRLEGELPAPLRPIVQLALARAAQPLPVTALALALGLHRKTLWLQCRRHGVPSVQEMLMWCRLIAVSHALRTRTQSVERIANEMEFASPTALRNATRRYLGVTPTALREGGGEELACQGFGRWLRSSGTRGVAPRAAAPRDARRGVTAGDER